MLQIFRHGFFITHSFTSQDHELPAFSEKSGAKNQGATFCTTRIAQPPCENSRALSAVSADFFASRLQLEIAACKFEVFCSTDAKQMQLVFLCFTNFIADFLPNFAENKAVSSCFIDF